MKLYELKKGDRFFVFMNSEPKELLFDHVDGMYSYCTTLDTKEVVHIAAFTEVEKVLDNI